MKWRPPTCCHHGKLSLWSHIFMQRVNFWNPVDVCTIWIDFLHLWIACRLKIVEHLVACSFDFICACNLFCDWSSLMQKFYMTWFLDILLLTICFYALCFLWWQQKLLDGIAQALEDETACDLVFGALMLQVPNL